MTIIYETARTMVRHWTDDDADRVFDILRRDEVVRWLGGRPPLQHRDEAVARIGEWRERFGDGPYGCWAVVERSTGVPAGSILLKPLPNGEDDIEIGWHFHPDAWGRGLASESARGALRYGFETVGLAEIWAITHLTNDASMRVCRAIGMRDLGVVEDRWYEGPSHLFQLSKSEYEATKG
jgi:RimJ/RimL family protein N-acetyltransferase